LTGSDVVKTGKKYVYGRRRLEGVEIHAVRAGWADMERCWRLRQKKGGKGDVGMVLVAEKGMRV